MRLLQAEEQPLCRRGTSQNYFLRANGARQLLGRLEKGTRSCSLCPRQPRVEVRTRLEASAPLCPCMGCCHCRAALGLGGPLCPAGGTHREGDRSARVSLCPSAALCTASQHLLNCLWGGPANCRERLIGKNVIFASCCY